MAHTRGVPPPGYHLHVRAGRARSYTVVVSPTGVIFPSCLAAWRHYSAGSPSNSTHVTVCSVPPCVSGVVPPSVPAAPDDISPALQVALSACGFEADILPCGVSSCMRAAFASEVPDRLRNYCLEYVDLFGPDTFSPNPPQPAAQLMPPPPPASRADTSQLREIAALRAALPPSCERAMLGSEHSINQATPAMCEAALLVKFKASAGPTGSAAARDRRDLQRYIKFCQLHAVTPPFFPVGSVVFPCFVKEAVKSSTGSKGGVTVEYSIKTSFVHMRDNYCLPVEFDAPTMLNVIKPYKGDSDAATSPTQFMVYEWERLSVEASTAPHRMACIVAVLATYLTLRAAHFVDSTVHKDATDTTVVLNLARDKDTSTNIWAGCEATGQRGPFLFWPAFLSSARARGFLIPQLSLTDAADPLQGDATLDDATGVSSAGMRAYFILAFALVGVSPARQRVERFTGHSPRHFLPCFAELLLWLQKFVDEVGRWASGAANSKSSKCGPRYTVKANQAMQLHLRRRLVAVLVALLPAMPTGEEGLTPCFMALSEHSLLTGHPYFGPSGVGFLPPL